MKRLPAEVWEKFSDKLEGIVAMTPNEQVEGYKDSLAICYGKMAVMSNDAAKYLGAARLYAQIGKKN